MEGHVVSDLLLYRICSIGDNDNYDKISPIITIIIIITKAEEQWRRPSCLQTRQTKQMQKLLGLLQNLRVRKSARKDPGPKYCLMLLTCCLLKIMSLYPSFQSPSKRIIISGLSAIMCLSFYLSRSVSSLCLFIYLSTSLFINLSIFWLVLLLLLVVGVAVIVVTPAQIIVVATLIVILRNYWIKSCVLPSDFSSYRSS